jgi:hypothetical protein
MTSRKYFQDYMVLHAVFLVLTLLSLVMLWPAVHVGKPPRFGDGSFASLLGIVGTATVLSVWIGAGGPVSPWRLVVVLAVTSVVLTAGWRALPNASFQVLLTTFVLVLYFSLFFLILRLCGWQIRPIRRARALANRPIIAEGPASGAPVTGERKRIQFTLGGMLHWMTAAVVVSAVLATLKPMMGNVLRGFFLFDSFSAMFVITTLAPVGVWAGCGLGFPDLRAALVLLVAYAIWQVFGVSAASLLFVGYVMLPFFVIRLFGYRFLYVANRAAAPASS